MEQIKQQYIIIALYGPSGSGKDTILKKIQEAFPDINKIVPYTTRPKREKDIEGQDYFFISNEEFAKKVWNYDFIEATSFNDWHYGTSIQSLSLDKVNVGVFNPAAIECILQDPRVIVKPVEIYASDKQRLQRALSREEEPDCQEICRRFLADKKDFSDDMGFWHGFYWNKDGKVFDKGFWTKYINIK